MAENNSLERKFDDFATLCNEKFEQLNSKFGRLDERIAAYMGIAERIEERSNQDIRELGDKYADHEARIRSLEATNAANGARTRLTEGAINRLLIPVSLAVIGFLALSWADARKTPQVTVTSAPVINPQRNDRDMAE